MLTFFTTAKPFIGHTALIQRNALRSWLAAAPGAEVLLFGDDQGAAETARELNIRHIPEVRRAPGGPKALRSFFCAAQRIAKNDVLCYVNCDIILTRDFLHAVNVAEMIRSGFLMVGRRWNLEQSEAIPVSNQHWAEQLTARALKEGQQLSGDWIDYFVFPRGLYMDDLPDFVIGRVHWDQWLVWKARTRAAALVDASPAVIAIHQNHDYGYHPAGKPGVWCDELSLRNYHLAGGRRHLCTIDDATHLLGPYGLQIHPERRLRAIKRFFRIAKETARAAAMDFTRPMRRAIALQRAST